MPEEEECQEENCSYICPLLHPITSNNHNLLHIKNKCYFFDFHKSEGVRSYKFGIEGEEGEIIDRLDSK